MYLNFAKMHGLGNDFVVFDGINQNVSLTAEQARALAHRRTGIGCDQILIVERPTRPDADFRYRILNADGGEVEQCGNGARCFVRFVRDQGLTDKDEIAVETRGGMIYPRLEPDGQVRVNMGMPRWQPSEVPFVSEGIPRHGIVYDLDIGGAIVPVSVLSMGNPHAVQLVEDVDRAPVLSEGSMIESHPRFPRRTNAGYMQVVDRGRIRLRVYERGAGETLACGTGACAAVVAGRLRGLLDAAVEVSVRGGLMHVVWQGEGEPVWLTGPVARVFDGRVDLQVLQGETR